MSQHLTNITTATFGIKLSAKQVYVILALSYEHNFPHQKLADTFNVSKQTIQKIVNGKSRKDCFDLYMHHKESHLNFLDDLVTQYL